MPLQHKIIEEYVIANNLFSSVDAKVTEKLQKIIQCITDNILQNLVYVSDACKCSTIKETHFKAITSIISSIKNQQIQMGGDPVQSSEFYGVDSGRYFSINEVAPLETSMFSNENLARVDMVLKGGGMGSTIFIDSKIVKDCVDVFMKNNKLDLKINSKALDILTKSVQLNIMHILEAAKSAAKKRKAILTVTLLEKVRKSDPHFSQIIYAKL